MLYFVGLSFMISVNFPLWALVYICQCHLAALFKWGNSLLPDSCSPVTSIPLWREEYPSLQQLDLFGGILSFS
jgi:hypothetical protein